MIQTYHSVAIDGPAGAGKSTVARAAAKALGFVYVDTGAIYRTVGYHMDFLGIGPRDTDGVTRLIGDANIRIEYDPAGGQHMILNGSDVTEELRTPEMSKIASAISGQKVVRDYLLEMQRDVARNHSVVMDGRDIGTVVLPHADVKIFLTASPEIRARRRFEELSAKGEKTTYEQVLEDQRKRDEQDAGRKIAPLKQAKDAILLDTSGFTPEQSVEAVVRLVREKLGPL